MKKLLTRFCVPGVLAVALVSCSDDIAYQASPAPQAEMAVTRKLSASSPIAYMAAESRAVIGTGTGSTIYSDSATNSYFKRLNPTKPDGLFVLDYRNKAKVDTKNMRRAGDVTDSAKLIKVRFLKDGGWSSEFPLYFSTSGNTVLLGDKGKEYSIEIENTSDTTLEVVLSVDGLNTITREKASFKNRGYMIAPESKIVVQGWGGTHRVIQRFKFTDSDFSLSAQKASMVTTRDIGVIGFAVFKSKTAYEAGTRRRAFSEM